MNTHGETPKQIKRRRARGSGSVYSKGSIWWIAYRGPDGRRIAESSGSELKGAAQRLLDRRVGAREHGLPVIPNVERTTFDTAAQAVVDDFTNSGKKSLEDVKRRLRLHLTPAFGGRKLVNLTATDIRGFVAKRRADSIVVRQAHVVTLEDGTEQQVAEQRKPVSAGEINRELQILKRIFNVAIKDGKLSHSPRIEMLREDNVRQGFFEPAQLAAVLTRLPKSVRPVIEFASITGWRIGEILPLEWRQVDFGAGDVKLDAGKTKNREGRTFPMTAELRLLLKAQEAERDRLKHEGHIVPTVFFKMVAEKRGGERKPRPVGAFRKSWRAACRAAGCPGRIPHDLRRTAVRNFVRVGIPERVAMKLTGHKTRSVFDRYDITSPGDLLEAARKLDVVLPQRQVRQAQ